MDAFGRLRVSTPYTLLDSQNRYYPNQKFFSYTYDGASIDYSSNESTVYMNVSSNVTAYALRETKHVFGYQPGKSLLVLNTFVLNSQKSNLVQRVGYYGALNGIFLEVSDDVYFVKRNNGTDTRVSRSNWNGVPMCQLDFTKAQIMWMDIEWLGVGNVKIGFIVNGEFVTCHTFRHANYTTGVYMATACLPIRYEIYNIGPTSSNSTMKQICSSVMSEGGYDPRLPIFSQLNSNVSVGFPILTVAGKLYPLVSIRLKSTNLDALVFIKQIDFVISTKDSIRWSLLLNSTLTGTNWVPHQSSNLIEVDVSSTDLTGGLEVNSGLVLESSSDNIDASIFNQQLGRYLNSNGVYTSDVLTLAASGFSASAQVGAMISWNQF